MPDLSKNVGFIDRLVRGLIAIDLLAFCLASFISGVTVLPAIALAAYFGYSGATGHCPLYSLLGRSSRHPSDL